MTNSESRLEQLQRAVDLFVSWREDPAGLSPQDFLARHAELRPLLEPMVHPVGDTTVGESQAAHARIEAGERLGDYELLRLLGEGGMGRVFEAAQASLHRRVTIKVLHPELTRTPAEIERFRREAAAAANLRHPGIVPIFEVAESRGVHYFVMEHVDGTPLNELLRNGLPVAGRRERCEFAARTVAAAAAALHYAHGEGVVHRDVKPHNLLLTDDGDVRLLDFGLASAPDGAARRHERRGLVGTPHYMSPEQARGDAAAPASDVFSCGVVLFELLSGRRPFDGPSTTAVLGQIVAQDPAPVAELRGEVPRELLRICATCLEKDPSERYRSAAALAQDLDTWRRRVRRRPMFLLVAALVIGLAIAVPVIQGIAEQRHERELAGQRERTRAAATTAADAIAQLVDVLEERLARQLELEPGYGEQIEAAVQLCEERLADPHLEPSHRRLLVTAILDAAAIYPRLGDPQRALTPLQTALDALAELEQNDATAAATRALTARTLSARARVHDSVYDRRALADARAAATIWRELRTDARWGEAARLAIARLAILEARLALDTFGGLDRATERLAVARSELEGVTSESLPAVALAWCQLHVVTGKLHLQRRQWAAAQDEFEAVGARLAAGQLERSQPDLAAQPNLLAQQQLGIGIAAVKQGDRPGARAAFDRARAAIETATAQFPSDANHQRTRAAVLFRIGSLHLIERRYPEAIAELERARALWEDLFARSDEPAPRDAMALAVTCAQLANCHLLRRPMAPALARPMYERALALQTALHEAEPDVVTHLTELGGTHSNFASWHNTFGEPDAARAHASRAIELQSAAYARRPGDPRIRQFLAIHHSQLAAAEAALGHPERAIAAAERSIEFGPGYVTSVRVCAEVVARIALETESLSAERVEELRRNCVLWLQGLTRGSATGVIHLLRSPKFDSLRERADFQQLVREVAR